ncbi:MAG: hypothetical protein RMA76_06010 [Deltaproteobacteria bacterium]|jgi:hypothetical protein
MSRPPAAFFAQTSRAQLVEMVTPTYAKAKNLDLNEAYYRLEDALKDLQLIEGLQYAIWDALVADHPDEDETQIVERVRKKTAKKKRFKSASWRAKDEGAMVAFSILVDRGAGRSSGEALDLLETDAGQQLLARGFEIVGAHLAKELVR